MKLVLHRPRVSLAALGIARLAILDLVVPTPAPVTVDARTSRPPPIPPTAGATISMQLRAYLARHLQILAERHAGPSLSLVPREAWLRSEGRTRSGERDRQEVAQELSIQAFVCGNILEFGVGESVLLPPGDDGYRVITRQARVSFAFQVLRPSGEALWTRTITAIEEATWLDGADLKTADPLFLERLSGQGKRVLETRRTDSDLLASAIRQAVIDAIRDIAPYYTIKDEEIL